MITKDPLDPQIAAALNAGRLIVMRTDTIYGILARANSPEAVERLYTKRPRHPEKSCIILVNSVEIIPGLRPNEKTNYQQLSETRPTTIVVPAPDNYLPHLIRTKDTLAFRVVSGKLGKLIKQTGPLLAPSANPEGLPPATNIYEAINYFGESVDVYVDGGEVTENTPSRIISFQDGALTIIRQ